MNMGFFRVFLCIVLMVAVVSAVGRPLQWNLSQFAKIHDNVLTVDVPKGSEKRGGSARAKVDLSAYAGKTVLASIQCEGTDLSVPLEPWNGLKFMFHYVDPATKERFWPNTSSKVGTFLKQRITVKMDLPVEKLTQATLTLGLQSASGRVVFYLDTLEMRVVPSLYPPLTNQAYRVTYPERVQKWGVCRGVMLPGQCKEADFAALQSWNVNLARYQMTHQWNVVGANRDLAAFDRWLDGRLAHLEEVLVWAKRYGLRICIDLHTAPGGRYEDKEMCMFHEKKYADHFIRVWERIATRFKGNDTVYGYDLINEPFQKRHAPFDYWNLQRLAAEAIRRIDPDTPVVIESNEWDSAPAYRHLSPLAMDNVIYQVHCYLPFAFTHQGVHQKAWPKEKYLSYPRETKREVWNQDYLRRVLKPVRDFQLKHNARIYVGEFSAIAWAPGADRYLKDCIELFEEYGWDWSYHAFREWRGWSVEHEAPVAYQFRPSVDNPRKRVLLDGFRKNIR